MSKKENINIIKLVISFLVKIVIVFIFIGAAILIFTILKEIMPDTKTNYTSYEEFYEGEDSVFLNKLPESSSDVKYYTYGGFFNDEYAVAFNLNESDYYSVKEYYMDYFGNRFKKYFPVNEEDSVQIVNQPVKENFENQEMFEALNYLANSELDEYVILYYQENKDDGLCEGVFVNEHDNRVIAIVLDRHL